MIISGNEADHTQFYCQANGEKTDKRKNFWETTIRKKEMETAKKKI